MTKTKTKDSPEDSWLELTRNRETWETLYRCAQTGAYWKKFFSDPSYHAGGAPKYRKVTNSELEAEWGIRIEDDA